VIVAGDMPGRNLAIGVARRPARQARTSTSWCWPTRSTTTTLRASAAPKNQPMLSREGMVWFWDHYLPDVERRSDPDASPLHDPDLSGLPGDRRADRGARPPV
jgi:acetyl esterase